MHVSELCMTCICQKCMVQSVHTKLYRLCNILWMCNYFTHKDAVVVFAIYALQCTCVYLL